MHVFASFSKNSKILKSIVPKTVVSRNFVSLLPQKKTQAPKFLQQKKVLSRNFSSNQIYCSNEIKIEGFEEKRVQIFRNGVRSGGIVASLLPGTTFEDLLNFVSDRFEIDAQNIYLSGGASIMDIALIKDNDTIYIAENEGYIPLESTGCILSRELNNILGNQETKTEMVFYLNGERKVLENMDPNITLLDYIRSIGLTGTKNVCGEGGCGACAVMVSNYDQLKKQVVHRTINSCMLPLAYVDNMAVTTVEGIGNIDELHPIQERIAKTHGVQCGYCTPGFVVNTYTVLCNNPEPTVEEIEEAVAGNLCRCTGYRPIFDAIKSFGRDYDPKSVGKLVPEMNHIKCRHKINTNKFPEELKNSNQKPLILTDGEYVWFKPTKLETLLKLKSSKVDMMLSKQLKNESEIEEKLHKRKNKISTISATVVSGNTEIGYERVYKFKKNRLMVSTAQVKELKVMEINEKEGFLTVGAGTTINDFGDKCKYILDQYPKDITSGFEALHEQTKFFANHSIRNMATLGGSLYTANPLSDLYPILMSVDAIANIESVNGSRRVPVREFVISKGKTCLKPEEILVSVDIPFTKKNQYVKSYKIGRRREDSQSIINGGFMVEFDENEKDLVVDACLAYGAIWETSIIAKKASEFLIGKKFNAQTAQECMEILEKEIPIMKRLGLIDLRKDLIKNIFFKFFVEIGTKQGLIDKNKPISNIGGYYRWPHRVAKQEFEDFNTEVGQPYKHLQAYESTTGEAKFITDLPEPEGTVFCAIVPSTKACARILKIDESEALKMKGVVSFLSAKDIPGSNYAGIIIDDEEIFASKQVNYYGHPIGIIVAETDELAKEAAKLVKIEYEELPFIQTIQEAIKEQSFFELDEERLMGVGDVEKAFEESDVVVEGEMFTEHQEHFYFETENCLVIPQPDQMLIYAAAQDLGQVQRTVSIALAKPKSYVTVKMHRLGGSFGGKQHRTMYISAMAAVAAKKLRRPVKFWLDRQTDMSISGMRHAFLGKYKMGINKTTGKINSVDLRVYNNGGHSLDLSSCVMDRGLWSTDNSYHFPNIRIEGKCCKTNRVSSTAYRSFGCAQGLGIIETAIEHASHEAGLDPDFVRTANLYEVGDITPTGWRLTDSKTHRVMKECKEKVNYEERKQKIKEFNKLNKYKKRGCSILPIKGSMGFEADFMCQQSALVNIYTDGTIHISHGGTEMGQGLSTKLAQVAATALGVSTSRIRVGETATDKIANAPPTAAVTGQGLNGRAVLDACRIINERLEPVKKDLGEKATFDEVILEAYFRKIGLNVVGHGKLDDFVYDYKTKKGRQAWYVSWSGVYTEVEIDTLTGEFQILHTEFVHDAGRSLNSAIDIGQIEGGFVQGAGFWTMEKPIWAKDGHLRTRNVSTYKIPAYSDIPIKFNVSLIDNAPNPLGVYSSKATGESGFHSSTTVFFAIRNAIKAAREESGLTDFFPLKAPLTIDNIQSACNMKVDPFDVEK
ncbi:aldehyde oxidase [Anaeramoeba flamelloides]|uniref:Aldehyde oxidase n=1 Tax=Anaeramoeba flamelloides TaxID=1746091 RepID=A0ABQ8Y6U9_9EUKA|nr:aldehyde oxidase [Anaeramoeba flamelloides]